MSYPYISIDGILTDHGLMRLSQVVLTTPRNINTYIKSQDLILLTPRLKSSELINAGPGVEVRIVTLKNGNYMSLRYTAISSDSTGYYITGITTTLYKSDGTPIVSFGGGAYNNYLTGVPSGYAVLCFAYVIYKIEGVYKIAGANLLMRDNDPLPWPASVDFLTDVSLWISDSEMIPDDPYGTLPNNDNPGSGYGPFDYTSETDLPPSLPSASAAQCGFVSLWNPTITELQGLASYLWTSGLFDINTWRHLFSNPMDCILSVGIIPFAPDRALSKEEIIFCGTSHSGISSYRVPTQMYIIPMGTMHIIGMSGGYTDYEPYAKASLFLPYCGTYALSCDEIVDADLSLEYHVDIYTGACVAYLTIERTNSNGEQVNAVMYQFTGNMLSTIPVTGADHSNFIQSLLFMGAAIGATVASSGAAAPEIGGAMAAGDAVAGSTALTAATAGSAINTVMSMKPNVMRSGNLSSNAGLLGKQAPTITMAWSNICRPEDEYKLAGMPLHKSGTLSEFEGFTVVSAVHMDNILCTEEEKTMIEELLYKGVII